MVRLDCQVPECEMWWLEGTFFRPGLGSRFVLPDMDDFLGCKLRKRGAGARGEMKCRRQ